MAAKAELERQQEEEKVKIGDLEEIRFAGRLTEKIIDAEIERDKAVRKLGPLIDYDISSWDSVEELWEESEE